MNDAKIVKRDLEKIEFELNAVEPPTIENISAAQRKLGYDPMGYSCFDIRINKVNEHYEARWFCWASCD